MKINKNYIPDKDWRLYQCRNCGNYIRLPERIIPYCGWCIPVDKPFDMIEMSGEVDGQLVTWDEVPA